jgi:uncharacterized membrane protein
VYINIIGGGHCYFADANFLCSLGEFGCPPFSITREQQHATTIDFTKLFLGHYLKKQSNAWVTFNDSLTTSSRITFQKSCVTTFLPAERYQTPLYFSPNPTSGFTSLVGTCSSTTRIRVNVSSISGKKMQCAVFEPRDNDCRLTLDMQEWAQGIYVAEIIGFHEARVFKIVKN